MSHTVLEAAMELIGRRFDTGQAVRVEVADGRVAHCAAGDTETSLWIAPGLVDLQVNGFAGVELTHPDATPEGVEKVALALDEGGVTQFLPTVTTQSYEILTHSLATIRKAEETSAVVQSRMAGIHLEGPYLSAEDGPRGAHPLPHCKPPDWDEFQQFQEAAGGRIKLLTLAPELPGSIEFIERAVQSGVLVAIGHTAATPEQVADAVNAGARMSTHLGNGAHGTIRRHPNYIWSQLADDRLTAGLIADCHHLPPEVLKTFVRAKTPERTVLVSDVTGMAGMPPGRYGDTSLGEVEVLEDGRLVVAGQRQYLAGASLPLCVGVGNLVRYTDATLAEAIEMSTSRPAALVGARCGGFQEGDAADFVLFEFDEPAGAMTVRKVINQGEVVSG